ncbi:MAG: DUF1192 domain-containing protein [Hyphomonadaceae bacterium]|nr:DUF1192 domain-containing protein [Hyphomonadaceae bacterium]
MDDDDAAANKPAQVIRLEDLSIRELYSRMDDLKAEIKEIEAVIAAKEASKSAADLFFKPSSS